jgi:CheY-like chemotaxis protein
MPQEVIARAFEPFFTTKTTGKAPGLGLSQVYGFVRSAGGHVGLDSQPGRGTTVHMYFPKSDKPAVAQPKPELPASTTSGGETILVVEDDRDVREVTLAALIDLGYRVQSAANAQEALDILRGDAQIDLLFSDIVMPGEMNGLALAAEARHIRSGLKVLLTSGHAGTILSRETGLDCDLDVLEKPYHHEELATRLRRAITG